MLALTKKTSYGLIAMTYLTQIDKGGLASAREIADRFAIPVSLLCNVMKELSAAGYVESVRGVRGGYRLARSPDKVNIADLVSLLEGPIRLAECVTSIAEDDECTCQLMASCPVVDPVHRVNRKIHDFLRKVTLYEIVNMGLSLENPHTASETADTGR